MERDFQGELRARIVVMVVGFSGNKRQHEEEEEEEEIILEIRNATIKGEY